MSSDGDFNYEQRPLTDEYLEGYEGIKWEREATEKVGEDKKQFEEEEVIHGR